MALEPKKNRLLWIAWILFSIFLFLIFWTILFTGKDKTVFVPGEMTSGHHQIGVACDTCHTDAFSGEDVMQEACIECHGDMRKKPFDSHPKAKFKDPRNAALLDKIDALHCVTCHSEHRPDGTLENGVTVAEDFCVHCHEDVAEERPSHEGMAFDTCNSAGCHNFHNNRALYTDFLIKHLDEPANLEKPEILKRQLLEMLEQTAEYPHDTWPLGSLEKAQADAPQAVVTENPEIVDEWFSSAHAHGGANCNSCHLQTREGSEEKQWVDHPGQESCALCHSVEVAQFSQGKHGMRSAVGLSPMTTAMARLPMSDDIHNGELTCNTCHQSHSYDVQTAAAEACLGCHADEHSLAWESSPHYALWQQELAGDIEDGAGVSCATCHMPRTEMDVSEWLSRVVVVHNQNYSLSPNEKMLRPACLKCHGLEFSLSALADKNQILSNFGSTPTLEVESMELARQEKERRENK